MQTIEQPKINQLYFNEFLEFKKLKDQGISIADLLTYSPLIAKIPDSAHNCQKNLSREGLPMAGKIRTDELCPKCKGKFEDTGKILECPEHLTTPSRYYLDLHYKAPKKKGIRLKIRRDRSGKYIDSYARAKFESARIAMEIEEKKFDPTCYSGQNYKKYIFNNFIQYWLKYTLKTLAPSSQVKRKQIINKHLMPHFKGWDIRDIKKIDLVQYLELLEPYSENYQNKIISELHKALFDAHEWELLEKMPKFPKTKHGQPEPKWITEDEQKKVLQFIRPKDKLIFQFLMLTGCRVGEARALMWDCIDFEKRIIAIKRTYSDTVIKEGTKTDQNRDLPMSQGLYSLLNGLPRSLGHVFISPWTGKPYTEHISTTWKNSARKAGIDLPLKNCTRHSFGSQRLNNGYSYEEIGAILGHTNIRTTQKIYTEFQVHRLSDVMEGNVKIVQIDRPETVQNKIRGFEKQGQ